MGRIRTIKPDFWRNDGLSSCSAEAALLAIGLLNCADDDGFFLANPKLIEADVFPLRELSGSTTELLKELQSIGYISLFLGSDGKRYGCVVSFAKHQVINKKTDSKIKGLIQEQEDYSSDTVALPSGKERKGKERKGMEEEMEVERKATSALRAGGGLDSNFEVFWKAYPKKVGKASAAAAWSKAKAVTIDLVANALLWQVESDQWTKDGGQFIPNPATYLNQARWLDEPPVANRSDMSTAGRRTMAAGALWVGGGDFIDAEVVNG
jgi:hypothetical protein